MRRKISVRIWLRALGWVFFLVLLWNPVWVLEEKVHALPRLKLLLDVSGSMGSRQDSGSALRRSLDWLRRHERELARRAEVSLYVFSDRLRKIRWEDLGSSSSFPEGGATHLGEALSELSTQDLSRSAVWLFSDGRDNGPEDPRKLLGSWGVPLSSVGISWEKVPRDLRVSQIWAPRFAYLRQPFRLRVRLEVFGLSPQSFPLKLYGEKGRLLQTQQVRWTGRSESMELVFEEVPQQLGTLRYGVEVPPLAGETNPHNNRREISVEVARQTLRVLYLCGSPSPEYASLRRLLKSDPKVELVSFVILRDPQDIPPVPERDLSLIPFPAHQIFHQDLFQFDLFILENFSHVRFQLPDAYLAQVVRFVLEGGGWIVLGGPHSFGAGGYQGTPLEAVLPVELNSGDYEPGSFQWQVQEPNHPVLRIGEGGTPFSHWGLLPPTEGRNRWGGPKPGALVLASAQGSPILAAWKKGKGRVLAIGTHSTWLWKAGAVDQGEFYWAYNRFWNQGIRWVTGAEGEPRVVLDLQEPFSPESPSQKVTFRVQVRDEALRPLEDASLAVEMGLRDPRGETQSLPVEKVGEGIYAATEWIGRGGTYRIRAVARRAGVLWGEDHLELETSPSGEEAGPMLRERLEEWASLSGGGFARLEELDLGSWLEGLPPTALREEVRRKVEPASFPAWVLGLMGILGTEWFLRRRRGQP
ncbi:MAG: hypothetical protein HY402_07040 [Elusimicrobia bacterium]|nr:hypothetical protein [Elusimicrobiota bacterium]